MSAPISRFRLIARRSLGWVLAVAITVVGALMVWRWAAKPEGKLVQVREFGENPTGLEMHLYVPPRRLPNPPVILALHWCQGSGPIFYANTRYAQLADKQGYIVIYPSVTRASQCWDVHSPASLIRDGASDPRGLLSMLRYVVEHHDADSQRLFVTGFSSGGMMTQVLLGTYPDIFKAGAAFAGVPFGCFAGPSEWQEACALGKLTKTPQEWAELVQRAYPTFTGRRPAVQLWHGTEDDSLHFNNFGESIKQWTYVLGTSETPVSTVRGVPDRRWTRMNYAVVDGETRLEAFRGQGVPHNFNIPAEEVIRFFGLD